MSNRERVCPVPVDVANSLPRLVPETGSESGGNSSMFATQPEGRTRTRMNSVSMFPTPPVSDGREIVACRPNSDTDLAFVLRAREGDQTAFRALWDKHWPG